GAPAGPACALETGAGSAVRMDAIKLAWLAPRNALLPDSISYSTAPNAKTLPKRGYRFIAAIQDAPSAAVSPLVRLPGRLVGRDAVLAELSARLDAAVAGRRQVIFVTGEAGIGKTSLVDTFHD